jgi:hypothetical protein
VSVEYLKCRDRSIGHDWDVLQGFHLTRKRTEGVGHRVTRTSRCTRCTTHRVEYFDHTGTDGYITKVRADYTYPEDYAWPPSIRAADVYTEQFRRERREARAK